MNAPNKGSQRLQRLEEILAASKASIAVFSGDERDAATVHLDSVPLERIRQITAELLERGDTGNDEIDALAARLLLNEYTVAVAHLRAVAREAGQSIDSAAVPLHEIRKFLWRDEKLRESRRQALEETGPE